MAQSHLDHELSLYLDDVLPADERSAVAAHLAGCPACRMRLAELQGVSRLVAALPQRAPRRSLLPRPSLVPRWLAPARWASTAAAAVFAVAFVATSLPGAGGGASTAAPAFGPAAAPAAQSPSASDAADQDAARQQEAARKALQASQSPAASPGLTDSAGGGTGGYGAFSSEPPRATAVPRGTEPQVVVQQRGGQPVPSWAWLLVATLAAALAAGLWRYQRRLVR